MGFSNKVAIAVCDRCNFKMKNSDLKADGNSPGLRVCKSCWDPKNPWRYPSIAVDSITLKYPRPDTPLIAGDTVYPDITTIPQLPLNDGGV